MDQDQKSRLGGVFFVVMGAVLGWLSIWKPYQEALAGSQTLVLNRGGIALAIMLPLMGILLAIGGDSVVQHLKAHTGEKKTTRGYIYLGVMVVIALATYYTVQSKFEAMGYTM